MVDSPSSVHLLLLETCSTSALNMPICFLASMQVGVMLVLNEGFLEGLIFGIPKSNVAQLAWGSSVPTNSLACRVRNGAHHEPNVWEIEDFDEEAQSENAIAHESLRRRMSSVKNQPGEEMRGFGNLHVQNALALLHGALIPNLQR